MNIGTETLAEVAERYSHAVIVFLGADGYPISVASDYEVDANSGRITLRTPAGDQITPPSDSEVSVVFSHIRPQPGMGYDQRRYVSLWGRVQKTDEGLSFAPERAHAWDEEKLPFFEYSEVTVPQSHSYMDKLGARQGREVKPRLDFGWLALRTTRAPFLTATIVPILLGIAVAALEGTWSFWLGLLTLVAGAFIHLGLNVTNDVFDTLSGADGANTTPTQFSGGSRVVHYGLVSMRSLGLLAAGFYAVGIGIGLYLALVTDFWPLFILGAIGVFISVFYTAPPFQFVHRGIGEFMVGLGFGPIMVLGAYFVQTERFSWEAFYLSLPVAILIALVLYVNEVPDRKGDAAAGKRTLPVRLSKEAVITGYIWAVTLAFALIGIGSVVGIIARPAIIALLAIPPALKVVRGLRADYEDPYALMPTMAAGVQLHAAAGFLLFVGYVIAIVADRTMDNVPTILG